MANPFPLFVRGAINPVHPPLCIPVSPFRCVPHVVPVRPLDKSVVRHVNVWHDKSCNRLYPWSKKMASMRGTERGEVAVHYSLGLAP